MFIFSLINFIFATEKEIPVDIKADTLKYIEGSNIVSAFGSVEIKLKEIIIYADSLIMDTKTKIVTAEGNVRITGIYTAECQTITYSVSNETSLYRGFSTIASPSQMKGKLFLKSDLLLDFKNKMLGEEGKLTTCDYASPHYFTATRKVIYYPNDKIEGFNVTFYIMDKPVLWAPYIFYDLKKKRKRNWSFGHNEVEGDFIKTSWDYPNGQIFLDEMQKKSFGQGINYTKKTTSYESSLYLYHIEEADTHLSDLVVKFSNLISITDKSKLGLNYDLKSIYNIPSGRFNQASYGLSFNHSSDRTLSIQLNAFDNRQGNQEKLDLQANYLKDSSNTSYNLNLSQGKSNTRSISFSERFSHNQKIFSDKTNLALNANYSNYINLLGQYGNELLESNLTLKHSESFYTIKYYENWRLDTDKDLYVEPLTEEYVESQPQITINFNPLDLNLFKLSSSLDYGWFHEVKYIQSISKKRDFSTGRYSASIGASNSINIFAGTIFTVGCGLEQYFYDTQDALNFFHENATLSSLGYDFFKNELIYTRGISDGNSPFLFDKFSKKYHDLTENMTFYYKDNFKWTNTCGFNYETNKYSNYVTNLTLKPYKHLTSVFSSGFDITAQKYLDLQSTLKLNVWENFKNDLKIVNDLNTGAIKQGNYMFDLEIADEINWQNHWKLRYGYVYNPTTKEFKPHDIMIIKDLHCWEVKYTYSDYRKEFNITFTLKAFPNEPLGYSGGKGFYFDSFEKAIHEELSNESPKRD